jgi:hypothetical protein
MNNKSMDKAKVQKLYKGMWEAILWFVFFIAAGLLYTHAHPELNVSNTDSLILGIALALPYAFFEYRYNAFANSYYSSNPKKRTNDRLTTIVGLIILCGLWSLLFHIDWENAGSLLVLIAIARIIYFAWIPTTVNDR